jgi:hypothetical protein
MSEVEALGEAVTGMAAAGAVEPTSGAVPAGRTHETHCLNCGCALSGEFCHCCGQRAHVHRTLAAWWHDFLHSVLHLDGKFLRTMPLLVVHPGQLTRRYIAGERARFISPLALFLFSVFVMFAVFGLLGSPMEFGAPQTAAQRAEMVEDIARERQQSEQTIARLETALAQARGSGRPTAGLEREIAEARSERDNRERAIAAAERVVTGVGGGTEREGGRERFEIASEVGWPPLDTAIAKAEANPSLLIYKMQTNAYKFSWALIPISLPFVWALFLHRRRYRQMFGAYDHLVFITYSIAFMSLGAIVLTLLSVLGTSGALIGLLTTLGPPLHMYRQLRGAYSLSRLSALWRTVALVAFSMVTMLLFVLLLVTLGVFG